MRPKSDKASEPKKRRSSNDKSENKRKPSSDRRKSSDAKPERKSRFSSDDSEKKKSYASDKRKFTDTSADKPKRFSKDSEKRDNSSSVRSKRFSSDESDKKRSFVADKRKSSETTSDKPKRFSKDSDNTNENPKRRFSSDNIDKKKTYSTDKRKFSDKNSDKPKRFSNDSDKKDNASPDRKKVWTDKRDSWNDDKEKPRRFTAEPDKKGDRPLRNKRFSDDNSDKKSLPFEKTKNLDRFVKKERKEFSETPFEDGNERPKRRIDSDKPFEKKPFEKSPNKGNQRRIVIEKNPYAAEREYPERKSIYSSDPIDDESNHTYKQRAGIKSGSSLDRKPHKKEVATPSFEEGIRLNRYIAQAGICSRREADVMITSGAISVNGVIVTELGIKVKSTDKVQVGGETLKSEKFQYVLLNKPKDYITTVDDPQKRNTVMDLVRDACRERIYPVGRLDRNTTGLLMLTNDGELAKKLTHPRYRVKKIYHAELDKPLVQTDFEKIIAGFELEDGRVEVDEVAYISPTSKREVGVEIHIGRNRIVRRMFEHLGYNVVKLDRVVFAGLTKKNLPRGRWRFLTEEELNRLKMNVFSR